MRDVNDMNDRKFIGYCRIHCETEIAMFHRDQIDRLCQLAGEDPPNELSQRSWWSAGPEFILPLCDAAERAIQNP